ncbi:glycoside hydrolase family 16 protein [Aspergillus stella-maris]|uniref:glycoside hydrolase family 16 protein n=1 Tax=Aspergillus stella-maris TaxID=1810926 RepID=UPI003CCDF3E8
MKKLSLLFFPLRLPSLSFIIATAAAIVLPPPTLTNATIFPRVPSHFPCDCYLVSGEDPGYFTSYKFYDFRDVPLPHSLNSGAYSPSDSSLWEAESVPLSQTPFQIDWRVQSWGRDNALDSIVPMINSGSNAFFAKHPNQPDTTQLVLRTTRYAEYSSTAEIESQHGNFFHCSIRVRMRLMSREAITRSPDDEEPDVNDVPKGACAGIFTYRSATCESDVEFLTSDPPNTIHYANQPDYDNDNDFIIPNASSIVTDVPVPWSEWTTHRMDWLSDGTLWYADDELQANITKSVPDRPSIIAMNLWSDGGLWTGDMRIDESVYMGIEWIEIAFNTSTAGNSPIETDQRHRHRPSDWGEGNGIGNRTRTRTSRQSQSRRSKRQSSGDDAGARCERPCYLDNMQYY